LSGTLYDVAVGSVSNPTGTLPPNPLEIKVGRHATIGGVIETLPLACPDYPISESFKLWDFDTFCGTGIINIRWVTGEIVCAGLEHLGVMKIELSADSSGINLTPTYPPDQGGVFRSSVTTSCGRLGMADKCLGDDNYAFDVSVTEHLPWTVRWRRLYEDWTLDEQVQIGNYSIIVSGIGDSGIANGSAGNILWEKLIENFSYNLIEPANSFTPISRTKYLGILPTSDPAWNNFTLYSSFESAVTNSGCYWFAVLHKETASIKSANYNSGYDWTLLNSSDEFYGVDSNGNITFSEKVPTKAYAERQKIHIFKYCPNGCYLTDETDVAISGSNSYLYSGVNVGTYVNYVFENRKTQCSYDSKGNRQCTTLDPDTYCDCSKKILNAKYIGDGACSFDYADNVSTLSFIDGTTGCYVAGIEACLIKKGFWDNDMLVNNDYDFLGGGGALCEYQTLNEEVFSCSSDTLTITSSGCEEYCGYCLLTNIVVDLTGGATIRYPLDYALGLYNSGILPGSLSMGWTVYDGSSYIATFEEYAADPGSYSVSSEAVLLDGFPLAGFASCDALECEIRRIMDYYGEQYVELGYPITWLSNTANIDGEGCGPSGIIEQVAAADNKTTCELLNSTYNDYTIVWQPGSCCGTKFFQILPNTNLINKFEFEPICIDYSTECPICTEDTIFSGTLTLNMLDLCREPDPSLYSLNVGEIEYVSLADCGQCTFAGLNIYDITDANSYDTDLEISEWGVPIDIDRPCNEEYVNKDTFTLWFPARYGNRAVPIISGVWYDTSVYGSQDIFKITTQNSPTEMRQWVCANLRFASKNGSGGSAVLTYNWPYNDLYWSYCSASTDVPINLVPC
jgi:hypothetical protein